MSTSSDNIPAVVITRPKPLKSASSSFSRRSSGSMPSAVAASSIAFSRIFLPWTSPNARIAVFGAVLVRQTSIWLSKFAMR